MKNILVLFCFFSIPTAAQLNSTHQSSVPNLSLFLVTNGDTVALKRRTEISAKNGGDIIIKVDPNDIRKEIFENTIQIELIHARGKSPVRINQFTGLKEFSDFREKLTNLKEGDRIVIAMKMMADAKQEAFIFPVK